MNGIERYKIFQDGNVSGAKASRPALDDMLNQIKEGKCKHLIVFSFSRFSRSCCHLLKSLEFLEKHKCRFTSVSEQIETSTFIKSFFKTLKKKDIYFRNYQTLNDVLKSLPKFIEEVYNKKRLHSSLKLF